MVVRGTRCRRVVVVRGAGGYDWGRKAVEW